MSEYLAKFIARCGAAARRKAAELVKAGKVQVNGRVVTDPAFSVDTDTDVVKLDGSVLQVPPRKYYIMLNKPCGYTTSHADKHAEHLAIELINCPEAQRLVPAGRLDRDSEGLLIFSNDGDFIQFLAHPRYEVHKLYRVTASKNLTPHQLRQMQSGISDNGETLHALQVTPLRESPRTYLIKLNEGKKREIRRMLKACGAETLQLKRIAMGPLQLGDLPCGQWRELTAEEVTALLNCGQSGSPSPQL